MNFNYIQSNRYEPIWYRDVAQRLINRYQLKPAGNEHKGPCPICGGRDRFHINAAPDGRLRCHCRYGCSSRDLFKTFSSDGLLPTQYSTHKNQTQSPIPFSVKFQALLVCDLVANQPGDLSSEDILSLLKAIAVLLQCKSAGVKKLNETAHWNIALMREELIRRMQSDY